MRESRRKSSIFRKKSEEMSEMRQSSLEAAENDEKAYEIRKRLHNEEASKIRVRKNSMFIVSFGDFKMTVTDDKTIEEVKEMLLQEFKDKNPCEDIKISSSYLLKITGLDYFLTDEHLPLHRVRLIQVCTKTFVSPKLEMVERPKQNKEMVKSKDFEELEVAEVLLQQDINCLISSLSYYLKLENRSTEEFRRKMTLARLEFGKELAQKIKEEEIFMLHKYFLAEPIPPKIPQKMVVFFFMPSVDPKGYKKVDIHLKSTTNEVIEKVFNKFAKFDKRFQQKTASQFVLKVRGFQDFLFGNELFIEHDYVRRCICKSQDIKLSVLEIEQLVLKYPKERADYMGIADKILEQPLALLEDREMLNVSEETSPWKIKIKRAEFCRETNANSLFFCRVSVFVSHQLLFDICTKCLPCNEGTVGWEENIFIPIPLRDVPAGARICFQIFETNKEEIVPTLENCKNVAWVNDYVWNEHGVLNHQLKAYHLWMVEKGLVFDPIATCIDDLSSKTCVQLFVDLNSTKIHHKSFVESSHSLARFVLPDNFEEILESLRKIERKDPLEKLEISEKTMLWENRAFLSKIPNILPKLLVSIDWKNNQHLQDIYKLLDEWPAIQPAVVLQLLSGRFSDPVISKFACNQIEKFSDSEILDFLPQLTQALKYQMLHDSPLAHFLLRRSFRNRHRIGHAFFWYLKSEMHLPLIAERYGLLLESYLRGAGTHRKELLLQNKVVEALSTVALKMKEVTLSKRKRLLHEELKKLTLPPVFQLPLDPRYEVKGLLVKDCQTMNSKKVPLWLVFENAEQGANPITVIFKHGDDLRQDILTLQIFRLMDKIWKTEGYDLRMNCYNCVSLGEDIGMIEVVMNATTMASIAKKAGGARKVFQEDILLSWLKSKNPQPSDFESAVENFRLSCAAYCVGTYILGIGDRHNDNIMITESGCFFHIDFGHFLGNFKTKFGIKREKAPFVFTHQFAYVMGGRDSPKFNEFVALCQKIFNLLRKHSHLFITLFHMMLSTGMPELAEEEDLQWLSQTLIPHASDEEAGEVFKKLIYQSLDTNATNINNFIHVIVKN